MKDTPFKVVVNDHEYGITAAEATALDRVGEDSGTMHILSDNKAYQVQLEEADYAARNFVLKVNGNTYRVHIKDRYEQLVQQLGLSASKTKKINEIRAPMPGMVLEISVSPGQALHKGDKVLILEAMKMENVLKSAGEGVVKTIYVEKGTAVEKGQLLIELE